MSIWHPHPGAKPDPKRRWANAAEMEAFERLVEAGEISFFRVGTCGVCKRDIPNAKDFCSRACHDVAALVTDKGEDDG